MPMPWTYRQATREWQAFLAEACQTMDLETDNVTYTAVQGVLQAFRRRLTLQQAIDFAQVLPSVVRALFVADWKPSDSLLPRYPRRLGRRGDGAAATSPRDAAQLRRGDRACLAQVCPA